MSEAFVLGCYDNFSYGKGRFVSLLFLSVRVEASMFLSQVAASVIGGAVLPGLIFSRAGRRSSS